MGSLSVDRECFVKLVDTPVLLQTDYPRGAGRRAVLTTIPNVINEVTLRMYRSTRLGYRGVWKSQGTRTVSAADVMLLGGAVTDPGPAHGDRIEDINN